MVSYPNPAGGSMEVANQAEAVAKGWKPSMGTFGVNSGLAPGSGSSSGGGGGGGSAPAPVASGSLDAQFQKMLGALASGNAQAFNEAKDEFNRNFAESQRQFNLGRDDSLAQFEKNFGLQQGTLTGMYNGQPTEQARQFNVNAQQTATRDQANLGTSLLNAATQIRGPKDYLQYQQLTRGGQNLMQQLYGNQQIPQAAAPTGQLQQANLGTVLGDIGWNPSQGGGQGAQQPNADMQSLLSRFGLTAGQGLQPNQIDPSRWDAMGQVGQDLTTNLASTLYGYDPQDFVSQINKTRPVGASLQSTALNYAQPRGIY